jgi:hypothetical protein
MSTEKLFVDNSDCTFLQLYNKIRLLENVEPQTIMRYWRYGHTSAKYKIRKADIWINKNLIYR